MGLKHVETIKSMILIILITLSLILTFSIWTYTPNYEFIEKPSTVDISVAEEYKKKDIGSIIKPYKIVFNFEEGLKGTGEPKEIDAIIDTIKKWSISNPVLVETDLDAERLAKMMRKKNQFILSFQDDVPLPVYDSVLNIENPNLPEVAFDRILIEWSPESTVLSIHFISQKSGVHYVSKAKVADTLILQRYILNRGMTFEDYEDVNIEGIPFIAVPTNPIELVRNTYFPNEKDEISPTRFRSALFSDPNAVRRSQVGTHREDYQDNHALMSVDTEKKKLQYVHPATESREIAIPSELLEDTIDFINEHGGWTDEYRFSNMNFKTRYVKFQLFVRGLPVLSGTTTTEIEQVWGEDTIYQYKRPYYTLDESLPSETEAVFLPSGTEIADLLKESEEVDFSTVEEIIPAYYLKQDTELNIFMLEPFWYYLKNGKWVRFSPEQVGGEKNGLE